MSLVWCNLLQCMLESTSTVFVARLSDACLWSGAISCSACLRVLLLLLLRGCQMLSHTRTKKEVTEYDSHTSQIRVATTVEVLSHTRTKKEVTEYDSQTPQKKSRNNNSRSTLSHTY